MKHIAYILLSLLGITVLTACSGGGGDGIAGGGRGGDSIGFLTLSITDAPIDKAVEVWVQVDGVTLKHEAESDPITISFNPPKSINLLALQGQNSMQLFKDEAVLTGNYNWIRLEVTAIKDGVLDSYIVLKNGNVHELDMTSGSEIGLKIKGGLRIIANTPTDMTVDFDLRKSVALAGGEYKLKPALKLVNDELSGSIKGTIELSTLTGPNCSDADPSTGNAVYLYEGLNVTPDDVGGVGEPDFSTFVSLNNATGQYEYEFGFIPYGDYTVAFTCQADLDDPEIDDDLDIGDSDDDKAEKDDDKAEKDDDKAEKDDDKAEKDDDKAEKDDDKAEKDDDKAEKDDDKAEKDDDKAEKDDGDDDSDDDGDIVSSKKSRNVRLSNKKPKFIPGKAFR